jgi:hypothetical protein
VAPGPSELDTDHTFSVKCVYRLYTDCVSVDSTLTVQQLQGKGALRALILSAHDFFLQTWPERVVYHSRCPDVLIKTADSFSPIDSDPISVSIF